MDRIPKWLVRAVAVSAIFGAGLGLGMMVALMLVLTDRPSIVVRDRWRVVTTSPPVTYLPETPFHVDPKVICETDYIPPTTKPSAKPVTTTTIKSVTTTTIGH